MILPNPFAAWGIVNIGGLTLEKTYEECMTLVAPLYIHIFSIHERSCILRPSANRLHNVAQKNKGLIGIEVDGQGCLIFSWFSRCLSAATLRPKYLMVKNLVSVAPYLQPAKTNPLNCIYIHYIWHIFEDSPLVFFNNWTQKLHSPNSDLEAQVDDFMLLVGHCMWGPGQLQAELDEAAGNVQGKSFLGSTTVSTTVTAPVAWKYVPATVLAQPVSGIPEPSLQIT